MDAPLSWDRGHRTYWDETSQVWKYVDTREICDHKRPCVRCGQPPTADGYDACLGHLDGIASACCGHGVWEGGVMTDADIERAET